MTDPVAGVVLVGTIDVDPATPRAAGIKTYVTVLADALTARGLDVHVVGASDDAQRTELPGGARFSAIVTPEPVRMVRFLRALAPRARALTARAPFLVHANRSDTLVPFVLAQPRRPRVLTVHNFDDARMAAGRSRVFGLAAAALERFALRRAHAVIAVDASSAAYARERIPAGGPRVFEVPVSVPPQAAPRLDGEHGARILFVGRFHDQKRPLVAVDAWRRLREKRPDATLTFIGEGPLAEALPQEPGVRVLTRIPDDELARAYRDADVLLVSSAYETGPLVIPEALGHGTPFVSTRVGRAAVWADAGGGLVADDDAGALAAALDAVLSQDPRARREAAAAAVRDDRAAMVEATLQAYAEAVRRCGA